jgi:elongation factor 1-alpha
MLHDIEEVTINIVGNVDSGKSTLCGILSNPELSVNISQVLDDGNGLARKRILALKHEQISGRTSSVTYNYMVFDKKIVSLVDLAGHEQYLKTTITGIMSSYPSYGLVLISKNITQITREHYCILASMNIPILFILTKIDIIPEHILNDNIKRIAILSKNYNKECVEIKSADDFDLGKNKFGYIKISNKTGVGIPLLVDFISKISNNNNNLNLDGFYIDRYYNITGFGLIATGISGINIKVGDNMFIGPFSNNEFAPIKVRSIHNDYKQTVTNLYNKMRGCLCIKLDDKYKRYLRTGMVICHKLTDVSSIKRFEANIAIFRGKSSNIKVGYNSYINVGLVRCGIVFKRFRDPETKQDIPRLLDSKYTLVDIEFMNYHNVISINDKFLFRSGRVNGIGKVITI